MFFTARALHRELEWRNHNVTWPHITIPVTEVTNVILKRINEGSVRNKITTVTLIIYIKASWQHEVRYGFDGPQNVFKIHYSMKPNMFCIRHHPSSVIQCSNIKRICNK